MKTDNDIVCQRAQHIGLMNSSLTIKRYLLISLISGLSIFATATPETVQAQSSLSENDLLSLFSSEIKSKSLKPLVDGISIPFKNNKLNSAYYRIVLEEISVPNKLKYEDCTKDFQSIPDSKFLDNLFDRKLDAGLAVILPLGLKGLDGKQATAELNLIHWKRGIKKDCRFAPSNFLLIPNRKYVGPWATIDHNLPGAIEAEITFRPWIIRSENSERKAAFWTGISAVASLFGSVGKLLFSGDSDKYSIRSQAELSLFGGNSGVNAGSVENIEAGKFLGPTLTIKPTSIASDPAPKSRKFSFIWEAAGEEGQIQTPVKKSFQYDFSVEYLGSIFDLDASAHYPDFSDAAKLEGILTGTIAPPSLQVALGKSGWSEVAGALNNLREQMNHDSFQAACDPAKIQLTDLGVSDDDATLLTFAIAKFSRHEKVKAGMAEINCLTSSTAQKALARFGIAFDFYQPLQPATFNDAIVRSRKTWTKGAEWEQKGVQELMSGKIAIFDENKLVRSSTSPVFSDSTVMDKSQLNIALASAQKAEGSGCSLSTLAKNKSFEFPSPDGEEPKSGWIIHLLEDSQGSAFLVASGFAGQKTSPGATIASAVLSHVWFGKPEDLDAGNWAKIRTAMKAKGNTDNCGRPSFKTLIEYQHPLEATIVPSLVPPAIDRNTQVQDGDQTTPP